MNAVVRAKLIALAHKYPEKRAALLPVIRKVADFPFDIGDPEMYTPDKQGIMSAQLHGKGFIIWLATIFGDEAAPSGVSVAERLVGLSIRAKALSAKMGRLSPEDQEQVVGYLKDFARSRYQMRFPS